MARFSPSDRVVVNNVVTMVDHRLVLLLLSVDVCQVAPVRLTGANERHSPRPAIRAGMLSLAETKTAHAALASSCCTLLAGVPLMAMRRGFMASGISRINSILSKPFSNAALFTWT
jgi:hypothetical protein